MPPIVSVSRALDIVERLASNGEMGVNELARLLETDPSTISRQLAFLASRNYAVRVPESGKYRLGLQVLALARNFDEQEHLVSMALDSMRALRDHTGESVALFVLENGRRLCLTQAVGRSAVLRIYQLGVVEPLWPLGSVGKALIAGSSEAQQDTFMEEAETNGYEPEQLRRELNEVRQNGFAWSRAERVSDAAGISAPVPTTGRLPVALNLGAAAPAMPESRMREVTPYVVAAASEISMRVGGSDG